MNLSTSSFKAELRAVALALVLLGAAEVGIRGLEPTLSRDVQHIEEIPAIVRQLAAGPGTRVLFLGNSMTRYGVDPEVLKPALAAQGVDPGTLTLSRIYPDASNILDWYYVYKHNIGAAAQEPDVLVVGFGRNGLADAATTSGQVERVARHYTALGDVPELFAQDLTGLSQRGDFLLAKASAGFAQRERIRTRVLDRLVPNYREVTRTFNEVQPDGAPLGGAGAAQLSYTRLKRFLRSVDPATTRVVFAAMPLPTPYPLDPKLAGLIRREGARLLDLRSVPGIGREEFFDPMHLSADGAELYSRALARELGPLLHRTSESVPVAGRTAYR